jgi:hypothetical protein
MSRLLLLLSLIGTAIYAFLIYTHDVLTDEKAEKTYAAQPQPKQPVERMSSWDTYLPDRSTNQNPQLASSQPSTPPQQSDEASQNSKRNADQVATSENKATSSESGDTEQRPVELAKVVLAAQTHSQASVSSPTVRFYRPGTELQVVRREGIWLEVSDPITQERGWVLAQYLASIESPTLAQVATESTTEPPTVISPKSNKRHRSAKHAVHGVVVANADQWNARWNRRADRRRGFGLFMFRPVPRFAQR